NGAGFSFKQSICLFAVGAASKRRALWLRSLVASFAVHDGCACEGDGEQGERQRPPEAFWCPARFFPSHLSVAHQVSKNPRWLPAAQLVQTRHFGGERVRGLSIRRQVIGRRLIGSGPRGKE